MRRTRRPIGAIIRKARLDLGLTADDVAAKCNVSRSRVYGWEKDCYVFPKNLPRLAAVLKLSQDRLRAANGAGPNRPA